MCLNVVLLTINSACQLVCSYSHILLIYNENKTEQQTKYRETIFVKDTAWKLTGFTGETGALLAANCKKKTNGEKAEKVFLL